LVEFALEVIDDIRARSQVRRDEDVGPEISPSRVVLVIKSSRCYPLKLLWILPFFSHLFLLAVSDLSPEDE